MKTKRIIIKRAITQSIFILMNPNKKTIGRSHTSLIHPDQKHNVIANNPYVVSDSLCNTGEAHSRDSSMNKSTIVKKPPTVPKPFRLSSSNRDKNKVREVTPNESDSHTPNSRTNFKAKEIPKSHNVPFIVLHSMKNLTHPETFRLKTNERSVSRQRSGSNQNPNEFNFQQSKPRYSSRNFRKSSRASKQNIVKQSEEPAAEITRLDTEESVNIEMFNFDMDECIKLEEEKKC